MKAWKSFYFEASHCLPDNPQIHGHSYLVRMWFNTSASDPVRLKAIEKLQWQLFRYVDHKHLNELMPSPTMESIADKMLEYGNISIMVLIIMYQIMVIYY